MKFLHTWVKKKFEGSKFFEGGGGLRTLRLQFSEGGGAKHPLRTLDGCADLLGGGVEPDFEFLGGVLRTLRTLVPTYEYRAYGISESPCSIGLRNLIVDSADCMDTVPPFWRSKRG